MDIHIIQVKAFRLGIDFKITTQVARRGGGRDFGQVGALFIAKMILAALEFPARRSLASHWSLDSYLEDH